MASCLIKDFCMSRRVNFCRPVAALLFLLLLAACGPTVKPVPVPPPPPEQTEQLPANVRFWAPLIERLERDGFARDELIAVFSDPQASFSASPMVMKLHELVRLGYGAELNRRIQQGLNDLGYAAGKPDGLAGFGTRAAIQAIPAAAWSGSRRRTHGCAVPGHSAGFAAAGEPAPQSAQTQEIQQAGQAAGL